jgi:hypothetical protein
MEKMYTEDEYIIDFPLFIYPTSTRESPHRKLAVDIAVRVWLAASFEAAAERDLPGDFYADTVAIIGRKLRSAVAADTGVWNFFAGVSDPCKYHEHTPKHATCYKRKRRLDT